MAAGEERVATFYRRHLRDHLSQMQQQRTKFLLWDIGGYRKLLTSSSWSWREKLRLLRKCVVVDWMVDHGHKPAELVPVLEVIGRSRDGVCIEAGCWMGGSTAKFSIACALRGWKLHVHDTFTGVPEHDLSLAELDWSGSYAGSEEEVRANVERYGELGPCTFVPGVFADTIRPGLEPPVRVAYIDCDIVEGTFDALAGIVPALEPDGAVFTQDFHIRPVREALLDPAWWAGIGLDLPTFRPVVRNLAEILFRPGVEA